MPSFYEEADSLGIVEEHIQGALKLEGTEADKIVDAYSGVRERLQNRLARFPRDSFSAQHLRGVMAQVEGALAAMNEKLKGEMQSGAYEMALSGVEDLTDEMATFDEAFLGAVTPINLNAAAAATDTTNFLVTKYDTSLDEYGTDLLNQIGKGLLAASIGELNADQVVGRIGEFFTAEEWKLRRIVRTELHNIYNVGKMRGMRTLADDTIPDLKKTLMHPMDQRTGKDSIYAAGLRLVVDIDEPFEYEWKGQLRSFMAPPDRPNDRAILVPYRTEWGAARGEAFIPGNFPAFD